ncbi:MAG: hypothetical protein V2B15_08800 [Bacteroidota bacterium]
MDEHKFNSWIYNIANDLIELMEENLEKYKDSINEAEGNESQNLITQYNNKLVKQHNDIHEILKQMSAPIFLKVEESMDEESVDESMDEESIVEISPQELKAETFVKLARYLLFVGKYEGAIEYAQNSLSLFTNQWAKYVLARSKENIPIQTKAFTSSSKKNEIEEQKKQEVISLYLETVRMNPNSAAGKDSAKRLILNYKHSFKYSEVY